MARSWLGTSERDRNSKRGTRRDTGERRRSEGRRDGRRTIRDLYKTDLDRHLWTPRAKRDQEKKKRHRRRRTVAGLLASAAGAVGLSFLLYRRLRKPARPYDPAHAEADLAEADLAEADVD